MTKPTSLDEASQSLEMLQHLYVACAEKELGCADPIDPTNTPAWLPQVDAATPQVNFTAVWRARSAAELYASQSSTSYEFDGALESVSSAEVGADLSIDFLMAESDMLTSVVVALQNMGYQNIQVNRSVQNDEPQYAFAMTSEAGTKVSAAYSGAMASQANAAEFFSKLMPQKSSSQLTEKDKKILIEMLTNGQTDKIKSLSFFSKLVSAEAFGSEENAEGRFLDYQRAWFKEDKLSQDLVQQLVAIQKTHPGAIYPLISPFTLDNHRLKSLAENRVYSAAWNPTKVFQGPYDTDDVSGHITFGSKETGNPAPVLVRTRDFSKWSTYSTSVVRELKVVQLMEPATAMIEGEAVRVWMSSFQTSGGTIKTILIEDAGLAKASFDTYAPGVFDTLGAFEFDSQGKPFREDRQELSPQFRRKLEQQYNISFGEAERESTDGMGLSRDNAFNTFGIYKNGAYIGRVSKSESWATLHIGLQDMLRRDRATPEELAELASRRYKVDLNFTASSGGHQKVEVAYENGGSKMFTLTSIGPKFGIAEFSEAFESKLAKDIQLGKGVEKRLKSFGLEYHDGYIVSPNNFRFGYSLFGTPDEGWNINVRVQLSAKSKKSLTLSWIDTKTQKPIEFDLDLKKLADEFNQ